MTIKYEEHGNFHELVTKIHPNYTSHRSYMKVNDRDGHLVMQELWAAMVLIHTTLSSRLASHTKAKVQ